MVNHDAGKILIVRIVQNIVALKLVSHDFGIRFANLAKDIEQLFARQLFSFFIPIGDDGMNFPSSPFPDSNNRNFSRPSSSRIFRQVVIIPMLILLPGFSSNIGFINFYNRLKSLSYLSFCHSTSNLVHHPPSGFIRNT